MGKGGLPMRDIVDLPFNALSYRVKALEDRIATQANQITAMAHQSLQDRINIRAFEQKLQEREKYFKTLSEKLACKQAQAVIQEVTPDLVVPKHLKKACGVGSGKMNKRYEVIKKRYALWKLQYESGFSMVQIARAWKCDHGSIAHAKRNNFIPKKSSGRIKDRFLSINKTKRIKIK
jgi:hypothetical protein